MLERRRQTLLVLVAIVLFVIASSCMKKRMAAWVGFSEAQLVSVWGAPDQSHYLPDGSKTLTWVTDYFFQNQIHHWQSFTIDPNGIVVTFSYDGC